MPHRVILESDSPIRVVGDAPPPPPPPSPPPPPPPPVDTTPFVWPPEWLVPYDASQRTRWYWRIPGREEDDPAGKVYVIEAGAGNPAGRSHHNAGLLQAGAFVGLRLWAPRDTPDAMLNQIIKTGVWP